MKAQRAQIHLHLATGEHIQHDFETDQPLHKCLQRTLQDGHWFYRGEELVWFSPRVINAIRIVPISVPKKKRAPKKTVSPEDDKP